MQPAQAAHGDPAKAHRLVRSATSFLTLREVADLIGKSTTNISYLIQYGHLHRYDERGRRVARAKNGSLRVSRTELLEYWRSSVERLQSRMARLSITSGELGFAQVPERERTKHVHRLHPYLGKFIPQLVEHFLSRHLEPGDTVVDPFCGSDHARASIRDGH